MFVLDIIVTSKFFLTKKFATEYPSRPFPPINKNFNVASFPGLFNSWEQQRGFFQNSPKGKEIWGELTKKTNSFELQSQIKSRIRNQLSTYMPFVIIDNIEKS